MKGFVFLLACLMYAEALAQAPAQSEPEVQGVKKDSSDYEVDYEEESGGEEVPEQEPQPEVKKASKQSALSKDTTSQGSRASNKISPLIKSNTKSVYKKNGKPLDVDPD